MAISTIPSAGITGGGFNFRNLIINGDMSIAQRGAGPSGTFAGSGYSEGPDRFRHGIANLGTWQTSQSTDVPTGQGFSKSFKIALQSTDASPAASDEAAINYRLEGQNLQSLKKGTSNAESVTLSFWVKSTKTGTYIAEIFDADNSRTINKAYTISSANTWEKKTITYEGDTTGTLDNDNARSLQINFWLGAGSNFTSGTLATTWASQTNANRAVGQVNLADTASAEWYITGVQLEVGTTASDFEFLPYDVNLQRCQRYFQIYMNSSSSLKDYLGGHIHDNDTFRMSLTFPVEFRTTPSLTSSSSGSADHWRVITSSINTNYGSAITFNGSTKSGQFTLADTGGTDMSPHVDDPGYMQNNQSSCYLKMDAEL